jgi:hypothetical protein
VHALAVADEVELLGAGGHRAVIRNQPRLDGRPPAADRRREASQRLEARVDLDLLVRLAVERPRLPAAVVGSVVLQRQQQQCAAADAQRGTKARAHRVAGLVSHDAP